MANLFESHSPAGPLANRMRPQSLDEIVGQRHLIGESTLLRRAILADRLGTVIFYGPPGTGKTTLARVISSYTKSAFEQLNAVTAKLDQLREVLKAAESRLQFDQQKTILFLDEIHRFNKMQQDALLPALEAGTITLIGATTENPSFEVNAALLSQGDCFPVRDTDDRRFARCPAPDFRRPGPRSRQVSGYCHRGGRRALCEAFGR